jgi:diacylglycerol kinase family enzyme
MEKISFEFFESTKSLMAWDISFSIDLEKYSALVAVGGDGTYH